jgi:hypothetical protein
MESAGNHQVQDEKQIVVESEYNPLAESRNVDDAPAFGRSNRGDGSAYEKRADDSDALESLPDNTFRKGLDVDGDIRQLGHMVSIWKPDLVGK